MPPLYPKMRERPPEFRINRNSPLYDGLMFAGLGFLPNTPIFFDSSQYCNHGLFTGNVAWKWDVVLSRYVTYHTDDRSYIQCRRGYAEADCWTWMVWATRSPSAAQLFAEAVGSVGIGEYSDDDMPQYWWVNSDGTSGYARSEGKTWPSEGWFLYCGVFYAGVVCGYLSNRGFLTTQLLRGTWPTRLAASNAVELGYNCAGAVLGDRLAWNRVLALSEIRELDDPSNVDLRVGGVPLILPPRRRFWPVVSEQAIPKMVPWHLFQQVSA